MVMELTEDKLRRLVRAVIKEQYDDEFDPEEYFNIMMEEIDAHHGHVLIMKDSVRDSLNEFRNMIEEIQDTPELGEEKKEILIRKILSLFENGDIYKI